MQVSGRVSLLGVNEVRELDWVLNEEDWSVVAYHVVVSFFSVELNSEPSRISFSVSCTSFASNS